MHRRHSGVFGGRWNGNAGGIEDCELFELSWRLGRQRNAVFVSGRGVGEGGRGGARAPCRSYARVGRRNFTKKKNQIACARFSLFTLRGWNRLTGGTVSHGVSRGVFFAVAWSGRCVFLLFLLKSWRREALVEAAIQSKR